MTEPSRFTHWRNALSARAGIEGRVGGRAAWRLTDHFFRAMFDFGILSQAGADAFRHMLLGGVGGFIATGLMLTRIYAGKYAALRRAASPEPYRDAVLGDDLFIIGLPMLLVAFMTLLISHSLFPDERDFRILGPLPVRKTVVFGAKLAALLLFTGLFIAVAHVSLVPLMLLTSMNPWEGRPVVSRLAVWAVAGVGASAFAVLAVTGIFGVLVLALSRSRLLTLTGMFRSIMLAVLVLCVPLVFHLPALGSSLGHGSTWLMLVPPAWFVGLEQVLRGNNDPWFAHLAGIALGAFGTTVATVAVAYIVLFRQFERLMLRSSAMSPPWFTVPPTTAFTRATPAFRAVYRFTTATLRRSQLHQSVLVGLSAAGLGIAMNHLLGADLTGWLGGGEPPSSALANAAMWTPFALMFACGLSVRAALALPLEHRANWIFRLTEDEATRREQLRAVDHAVAAYVVGVPVAATLPVLGMILGPTAVVAAGIVVLVGFVFVHAVLLDWRRIPFTCSYLPGKRFLAHSLLLGFAAFSLFTLTAVALVHAATGGARQAVIIAAALSVAASVLRRRRLAAWSETPLMFEDEFPDQPQQLRL